MRHFGVLKRVKADKIQCTMDFYEGAQGPLLDKQIQITEMKA